MTAYDDVRAGIAQYSLLYKQFISTKPILLPVTFSTKGDMDAILVRAV